MRIRKDCLHYHEEPYMGARVDCCLAETAFGMCPCTPDCENYIPKDSSVRIVRCKHCKYHSYDEVFCCYWCEHEGMVREVKPDFYCGYGEE